MIDMIELPSLSAPEGTRGQGGETSGSSNSSESTALYESSISASDMIAHFLPQLERDGWKLGKQLNDEDFSAVTGSITDPRGKTKYLTLSDRIVGKGQHDVSLKVTDPSRRY